MLGKLIKYDLKSMSRAFIPMWILAPVIAFLLSFSIRGTIAWANSSRIGTMLNAWGGILMAVMLILFIAVIVGLLVMTVVFVVQRFWNGLLKEEGYLMFTLPVKTWELIVSKALTATLIVCVSTVMGIFSAVVLAVCSTEEVVYSLAMAWKYIFSQLIEVGPGFWISAILFTLLSILRITSGVYHAYAAMALGHLFQTHKVIGSCVSYIAMSIAISILSTIINTIMNLVLPNNWTYYWMTSYNGLFDMVNITYLLYLLLATILEIIIYHVITERLLATKLNLE